MQTLFFRIILAFSLTALVALCLPLSSGRPAGALPAVAFLRPFLSGWRSVENKSQALIRATGARRSVSPALDRHLRDLRLELAKAEAAVRENRNLRALVGLVPPPAWRCVVAQIIARDPVSWDRRFRINRGSDQNIQIGAAVLDPHGTVIGRVTDVTPGTALVSTVADPACRISVVVGQEQAPGMLRGRIRQGWGEPPQCLIDFLPPRLHYAAGDPVKTSGLGDAIPPGILVGYVGTWADQDHDTVRIADGVFAQLLLAAAADIRSAQYVAVLIRDGNPAHPHADIAR